MAPRRFSVPLPFTGGVNLFNHVRSIRDTELRYAKNLWPKELGRLCTRPGMEVVMELDITTAWPAGLQFLPVSAPAAFVAASRRVVGKGVLTSPNNTMLHAVAAATDVITPSPNGDFGGVTQYYPAILPYNGKVYAFGGMGSNKSGLILQKAAGGGVEFVNFEFQNAGNTDVRPAVVGLYREQFVFANMGLGYESAFFFADPFQPTLINANVLAGNGSYFIAGSEDGDHITAVVGVLQTGAANAESMVLILKEFSGFTVTGDPPTTGDDGTAVVNRLPVDCGCSSQATVARTPFGILWAGPDDVWMFPEGQLPYRIGTKIRPALQQSPANLRYKWHAIYHDGFYKLAVFSAGQGPTDDSPCGEQWWLDLREGAPRNWEEARWWGPQVHTMVSVGGDTLEGSFCMALDVRPGADRSLYSGIAVDDSGGVYIASHFDGIDTDSRWQDGIYVSTGAPHAIDVEWWTKEYTYAGVAGGQLVEDPQIEKGFDGAELDAAPGRTGNLGWQVVKNLGRLAYPEVQQSVAPASGLVLDVGELDDATIEGQEDTIGSGQLTDERQLVALDPTALIDSGYSRLVGTGLQLQVRSKTGIVINESNSYVYVNTIEFFPNGENQGYDWNIPEGVYTLEELLAVFQSTFQAELDASLNQGTVTVELDGGFVRITVTRSGQSLAAIIVGGNGPADNQAAPFWALLGFEDSYVTPGYSDIENPGDTVSIIGDTLPSSGNPPRWDFGAAVLHFYPIKRRSL